MDGDPVWRKMSGDHLPWQTHAGDRVKTLRIARGMTQVELAKALGVAVPVLSAIEHGAVVPSGSLVDYLGLFLDIPRNYFTNDDQPPRLGPWNCPRHAD